MKKVLLGIFALSCISMAVETNVYLRAGGDISGEFDVLKAGVSGVLDVSVNESIDVNDKDADGFGWEIAVEATREIYPNLEFGFGVAFQDHDRPENGVSYSEHDIGVANPDLGNINLSAYATGYNSIPLYLTMKYNFDAINNDHM